jgi:hypothetical protein
MASGSVGRTRPPLSENAWIAGLLRRLSLPSADQRLGLRLACQHGHDQGEQAPVRSHAASIPKRPSKAEIRPHSLARKVDHGAAPFGLLVPEAGVALRRPQPTSFYLHWSAPLAVLFDKHVTVELVPAASLLYRIPTVAVTPLWQLSLAFSWRDLGRSPRAFACSFSIPVIAAVRPVAAAHRARLMSFVVLAILLPRLLLSKNQSDSSGDLRWHFRPPHPFHPLAKNRAVRSRPPVVRGNCGPKSPNPFGR